MLNCRSPTVLWKNNVPEFYPCGTCEDCREQRANQWSFRIMCELHYHDDARSVTLTYDDYHLPKDCSLVPYHQRKYTDELRERVPFMKFYCAGEYGEETYRPHYHLILCGVGIHNFNDCVSAWHDRQEMRRWYDKGNFQPVSIGAVRYVTGYIKQNLSRHDRDVLENAGVVPPFNHMSKGLGFRWFIDHKQEILRRGHCLFNGQPIGIPRYLIKQWKDEPMFNTSTLLQEIEERREKFQRQCRETFGVTREDVMDVLERRRKSIARYKGAMKEKKWQ